MRVRLVVVVAFLAACSSSSVPSNPVVDAGTSVAASASASGSASGPSLTPCSPVTFTPGSGAIAAGTSVVLGAKDLPVNALIFYTKDGTFPNPASSRVYVGGTSGMQITASETINAIAYAAGACTQSVLSSASYVVPTPSGAAQGDAGADGGDASAMTDSGPSAPLMKMIFVTAAAYDGSLGGIPGADLHCMNDAHHPLAGIYKAMLVDGASRASCTSGGDECDASQHIDWVLAANTTYTRVDGTVIGTTNAAGIFSFSGGATLENAIGTAGDPVRTGLNADWKVHSLGCGAMCNCDGFTNGTQQNYSAIATPNMATGAGIGGTVEECNALASLYCVEQ